MLSFHTSDCFTTVSPFWQAQNQFAEALDSSLEKWAPQNPPDFWHCLKTGNLTVIVLIDAQKIIY